MGEDVLFCVPVSDPVFLPSILIVVFFLSLYMYLNSGFNCFNGELFFFWLALKVLKCDVIMYVLSC